MMRSFCCTLLLLSSTLAFSQKDDRAFVRDTVHITGAVRYPLSIHMGNVHGYPVQQLERAVEMKSSTGEARRTITNARGVLLKDILDSAQVQLDQRKARGEYIVYVSASDGYNVIYAWNELNHADAGAHTWLLFEEDGKPLTESGRFAVLCTSDRNAGPRHVKWVERIDVRRVLP